MGKIMTFKDIQGTGQVQLGSAHPIAHGGCSYDVEPVEGILGARARARACGRTLILSHVSVRASWLPTALCLIKVNKLPSLATA